jgi:hypothetical protein
VNIIIITVKKTQGNWKDNLYVHNFSMRKCPEIENIQQCAVIVLFHSHKTHTHTHTYTHKHNTTHCDGWWQMTLGQQVSQQHFQHGATSRGLTSQNVDWRHSTWPDVHIYSLKTFEKYKHSNTRWWWNSARSNDPQPAWRVRLGARGSKQQTRQLLINTLAFLQWQTLFGNNNITKFACVNLNIHKLIFQAIPCINTILDLLTFHSMSVRERAQ